MKTEIIKDKDLEDEERDIDLNLIKLKEIKKDLPQKAYNSSFANIVKRRKELNRKKKIVEDMKRR